MAGGIQPGTSATSEESRKAEKRHTQFVEEACMGYPFLRRKKGASIEDLTEGRYISNSRLADGSSQLWNSDGGFIHLLNGEMAGVAECKYQKARANACERAFRYFAIEKFRDEPWRIFLSCHGEGFEQKDEGGATGPYVDMMLNAGVTLIVNPSDEDFRNAAAEWLKRIAHGER